MLQKILGLIKQFEIISIIALVLSGIAVWYSHRSNKISKAAVKISLYNRRKEIRDACIVCIQDLKLLSEGKGHLVSRDVPNGKSFRDFLEKISGFEDLFENKVKEWIEELRDHAYTFIVKGSNDELLGERLGCKLVKEEKLDQWISNQNIESIKCMFSKYMTIKDSF